MEAKESKINEILTESKMYFIPEYQRPYSWQVDNVGQLLDDLETSFTSKDPEYFIGSIICIKKSDNYFEVVDGQQRLTTLSLIICQLKNLIDSSGVKEDLQKRVLPVDVFNDKTSEPRLTVRKREFNLYKNFILQDDLAHLPSRPTETEMLFIDNSDYINKYLKSKNQLFLKAFAKYILHNVLCVFVTTNSLSSSFRLFNVLNNRGLPLSNSDLLKNSLFEHSEINGLNKRQVEDNWHEIESIIGVRDFDKFLRLNKVSEKKSRDRATPKDYESYISTLKNDFNGDAVAMSGALLGSARNYVKIIDNDFSDLNDENLNRRIKTLLNMSGEEWIPAIMAFLNKLSSGVTKDYWGRSLEKSQVPKFVEALEAVYMQSCIRGQSKGQRETPTYSAVAAINNDRSFDEIIRIIINYADDSEFIRAIDLPMYERRVSQINLVRSILLRIDTELQDGSVSKTYSGRITIEHVLPQKMSDGYWKDNFTESDHEKWVHRVGNLTLISGHKNSEAQNSDFNKKKSVYNKMNNKSSFDITKEICQNEDWNISALERRHIQMQRIISNLWCVRKIKI